MMGKGALFLLLVGIVNGFSVPKYDKNHQDALSSGGGGGSKGKNGSDGGLETWHGLDYEYGAFDHSEWLDTLKKKMNESGKANGTNPYEEFYLDDGWSEENYSWGDYNSDEDYAYVDDIIIVGGDKTKVKGTTGKPAKGETTKKEWNGRITIGGKKATTPVPPSKGAEENGDRKKENIDKDYSWEETAGDSDDGEGGGEKKDEEDKKNLDLPTDNDLDSDKYFDPQRYKDTLTLHAIEDLLMRQWTVNYPDTNLPCIMLKGSIKLIVPLNPTWYNKDFIEIDVPYDAQASGTCASLKNDYQEIILTWNVTVGEETKLNYLNKVVLGFATNYTSEFTDLTIPEDKYALVAVTAAYYKGELGKKAEDTGIISYSANDLVEFMTPLNHSMSCYQSKQLLLGSMQLTMSGIQLEAFRANKETLTVGEFSRSVLCSVDEVFVFDAVMTFIIWFWIGALLVVLAIFVVMLALGYRRRQSQEGGFGYKILTA